MRWLRTLLAIALVSGAACSDTLTPDVQPARAARDFFASWPTTSIDTTYTTWTTTEQPSEPGPIRLASWAPPLTTYDTTFRGDPIRIAGRTFARGIGAKGKSAVMFKVAGRADRFGATVALNASSHEDAKGRFRVYNEDFFANKVLWDSGEMTKDSTAKQIDIELRDVQCLMLVFEGKEALGNWADAHVINGNESN